MSSEEREELIAVCLMRTNYTEQLLRSMSDEQLLELYERD